jgi:glycosyltransferase involved in cell wall biosynthesis
MDKLIFDHSIAIERPPRERSHDGPFVFLGRLEQAIRRQKLFNTVGILNPFSGYELFASGRPSLFPYKRRIQRIDGLYIDSRDTTGDTRRMNERIFRSIRASSGVVFISDFSRKVAERFYGPIEKPWTVVHNSVPLDLFSPDGPDYRANIGASRQERVIVTSAHWRRHKRLPEIIKTVELLNAQSTIQYKLLVLGSPPSGYVTSPVVYFSGEIPPSELPAWYRSGDVYLHLCWIEACGNTQIEAMACGLPVVCCNNGGIRETVLKANGGVVAECDHEYSFELVDLYNPPEPNYDVVIDSLLKVFDNISWYRSRIDRDVLSIDCAAEQYCKFIKNI